MKNPGSALVFAWLSAAVRIFGVASSASQASAEQPLVTVNVPFDFQQGSQHLKAGQYTISLEDQHCMHLQGQGISGLTLSRPETGTPSAHGKLVFRAYGNRYFLREVWQAGRTEHQVLPESKAQKQLETEEAVSKRFGTDLALLTP